MTKKSSRAWVEHTVRYHEGIAAGFRASAERARSGRSTTEAAIRLENWAIKAERDAEYYRGLLRRSRQR